MPLTEAAVGLGVGLTSAALAGGGMGIQAGRGKRGREQAQHMFDEQMAFAREQYKYQQYVTENAYQIATADAEAAGLSPLAVTGGAQAPSGVSQPQPDSAMFDYGQGQDVNTFVDSLRAQADLFQRASEEKGRNSRNTEDNAAQMARMQLQIDATAENLKNSQNFELAQQVLSFKNAENLQTRKEFHDFNLQQMDSFKEMTDGSFKNYVDCYSDDDYYRALQRFITESSPVYEEYGMKSNMSGEGSSAAGNGGVSVGVGKAASVGINGGGSSSSNSFVNRGDNNKVEFGNALNKIAPFPIRRFK